MKSFYFFILLISLFAIIISVSKSNRTKKTNIKKHKNHTENADRPIHKKKKKKKKKSKKAKKQKKQKKEKKPIPLTFITHIPNNTYNIPNDGIYLLNDSNIEYVIQKGQNYKWFVLLFSLNCSRCRFARTEIRKLYRKYQYARTLRFAEIEINLNPITNKRFNIDHVPYIFMVINKIMYIFDSYPSKKNLNKFINTELFHFLPEEKKEFPPIPSNNNILLDPIKYFLSDLTHEVNDYLNSVGIKVNFTPFSFLIIILIIIILLFIFDHFCCNAEDVNEETEKPNGKNVTQSKEKKEEKDKKNKKKKE